MSERAHLTCPSCGKSAQREGTCTHCGARIDQTALAGVGIRATPEGVVVGEGRELRIGVGEGEKRRCPHCGADVVAEAGKTCPYCNGSIAIESVRMTSLVVEDGASLVVSGGMLVIGRDDQLDERLATAAVGGDAKRVLKLKGKGVDFSFVDDDQRTVVHLVVEAGRHDMIELLVSQGAPLDAKTKRGDTALHLAVKGGREKAVAELLRLGALSSLRDAEGLTPLELAERKRKHAIAALLAVR